MRPLGCMRSTGATDLRLDELVATQICTRKICAAKIRSSQLRPTEVRLKQHGPAKIRGDKVRIAKVGAICNCISQISVK